MSRIAREVLKATKQASKDATVSRAEQLKKLTLPGTKKEGKEVVEVLVDEPVEEAASRIDVDISNPELPPAPTAPGTVAGAVQRATGKAPPVRKDLEVTTLDEAQRIQDLKLDDFDDAELFQPNFDTFETTDDVTAVVADMAKRNKTRINEARRETITEDQLRKLSEDLDWDTDVIQSVMEREPGLVGKLNAERILAARHILNTSATRIKDLAVKITKGEGTDIERLKFRRQLMLQREFTNNFLENFMGVRAEAGRLLNAFGVPTEGLDVDLAHIREIVETGAGRDTDKIAGAIVLAGDNASTAQVSQLARKYTQSKVMGVVNELFVNSILSGVRTFFVNTAGNLKMMVMQPAERAIAARLGRFMSGEEHAYVGEASALMHGQMAAFSEALVLAGRAARTGVALDDVVKFEGVRRRSITAEHLISEPYRQTPLGRALSVILDGYRVSDGVKLPGVGQIIRAPTERVMLPTDEFFKTMAYRGELTRQAYRDAYGLVKNGELDIADAEKYIRNLMENPTQSIVKAADDYSRYITFQNPLGPRGSKFQLALRSTPILQLVAPFIRTPANIFTAGIAERSPLALARAQFWRTMKEGGEARDMALARVTMGSFTSGLVATMVAEGRISGAGPSDPEARRILELEGWQPYSIKVGDTWHSYRRIEPLAFVIGATADATEIMHAILNAPEGFYDDEEMRIAKEVIPSIITGISQNTISKTYLQGVVDFVEMATDPKRNFDRWSKRMGTSILPYSALRRQMSELDDPYIRHAVSLLEEIKKSSGIPGVSENAPPYRNVFGEPIRRKTGWLGPMSIMPESEERPSRLTDELILLMETTQRVPLGMPRPTIEGMRLNMEEYDALVRASRTEVKLGGQTFEEALNATIKSRVYKDSTVDSKVDLIKAVQRDYDATARLLIEDKNREGVGDRLARWRKHRDKLEFGVQ
jgi:hypothetical protein